MTVGTCESTFKVKDWQEDRSSQTSPRITPASIKYDLPEMAGSIAAEYLMTYLPDGNASFVFTETLLAENFAGKKGSFITQGQGTFDAKTYAVQATFKIVTGTGTGELTGISGKGSIRTTPSSTYHFEHAFE